MPAGRFGRSGQEACSADLVEGAVARAKAGDAGAVHFLYARFADEVAAFVRGMVNDAEAENVTRAVFAKLVRDVRHYEPGELPFATWILRFAEKIVNSEEVIRRRSAADGLTRAGPADDPKDGRSPPLHKALRRLPDDQRRVLVLRHIAGLSTTEIAERLGSSEASVRELHENGSRALQAARLDAAAASPE